MQLNLVPGLPTNTFGSQDSAAQVGIERRRVISGKQQQSDLFSNLPLTNSDNAVDDDFACTLGYRSPQLDDPADHNCRLLDR